MLYSVLTYSREYIRLTEIEKSLGLLFLKIQFADMTKDRVTQLIFWKKFQVLCLREIKSAI